ncbi:MAG: TetR/AcrR family transcriptional regulator [bacterium]|nr:TetR/AcrR family transcriptional regulator [bacterium]
MDNKRKIANAYIELLKKKNVDKITIKDIVERCGLTRQSFYYHFHDIFDLIEWLMNEKICAVSKETLKAKSFRGAVEYLLKELFDKYDIIAALLNSKERSTMEGIIIRTSRKYFISLYESRDNLRLTRYELETALDFYSCAVSGYMLGLCKRGDKNVERAADRLVSLMASDGRLFDDDLSASSTSRTL